ncbi:related to DOS1 protein [Fusarium fujikuroi]|uniref:BSD domain-containing protein n=1 Tax=Fusarium fujikuroi TaxID=5127 RepID=A0A9Q9REB5_FUSFU|nr:related to DOS1 protein [Fusarium fujikuroi]VTT55740.1 unnamed protein product [Fusarium fujikuroi]VTT58669.1 unnamed protein product [Fusarium fujikuroi]
MDLAYDHITEDGYAKKTEEPKSPQPQSTLNEDLQDAYKAFSNSPWGARIGGFFGNVVKQGESVYTQASKELAEVGEDASKGLTGLRSTILSHTRNLSLNTVVGGESSRDGENDQATTPRASQDGSSEAKQSENTLARLRAEAAKRIKDLQKAEDAADEALIKFGGNIRNFLRDAVMIAPPQESDQSGTVLFESKDAQGKRVIHTSRFDAQLHVIHTSTESFTKDPNSADYAAWSKDFDADKKTPEINDDLQKFPDLRATMEKLVPDQVPYVDFWKRYYFLRHGIETAEARRRDLLKAASAEDDVAWSDDDSDEDDSEASDDTSTPAAKSKVETKVETKVESKDEPKTTPAAPSTTATTATTAATTQPAKTTLKPAEPRKSNDEKSQADSEASYDVVGAASGKTTQTPNSPKDPKDAKKKEEEESSDEEDDSDEDDSDSDEDWE